MQKHIYKIASFLSLLMMTVSSCYYDNAEDLYQYNQQNNSGCDTVNVIYTNQIKPIFDNNCISCHNQGGNYPTLDNFPDAHTYATTPGNLLYEKVSTNHKNTNFTECELAQIKKWIEGGAN